jgi:anti-sigma B factor antagonist
MRHWAEDLTMVRVGARRVRDVLIIEIIGRLDSPSAGDAETRITNFIKNEDRQALLNLEKLAYLSSAGLRVIMKAANLLRDNRGELKICSARGIVSEALTIAGFDRLIKNYDTETEAFTAFHT